MQPAEAAYFRRSRSRRTISVRHPKGVPDLPMASLRVLAALSRGPAGTCRVPMHETGSPLLRRPRLHDGSTRPRLVARLAPRAHSRSTNPTRHPRSRRIAVREASPNARPSPAPYDRRFRVDPGSLARRPATRHPQHATFRCAPEPHPRRKNTSISIEVAAHGNRPMRTKGT